MRIKRNQLLAIGPLLFSLILCAGLCSCSTTSKPSSLSANLGSGLGDTSSSEDVTQLIEKLNSRIQSFENRLTSLDEKIETTRLTIDQLSIQQKLKQAEVIQQPIDRAEGLIPVSEADEDMRDGFVNDAGIQIFRRGWITLQAKKYPESILTFSEFVDKYPDHLLAGSAQYYVAKSYLLQKEYKLAIQEYQRVLASYPHDAHISDTLRDLVAAEEGLRAPEAAGRYRQLLTTLFPQSPATWSLAQYTEKPKSDSEETAAVGIGSGAETGAKSELVKADNQKIQNQAALIEMKQLHEKNASHSSDTPSAGSSNGNSTKGTITPHSSPTPTSKSLESQSNIPPTAPLAEPKEHSTGTPHPHS